MNNKGLTLIELMAVIAIIAILAIMITPGILAVRNSVLDSSYENKVSQIENAAIDYGQEHITDLNNSVTNTYTPGNKQKDDTNCFYRTVSFLINNGYLKVSNSYSGDNVNTGLTDPRDGSSLNHRRVCIRFDNNDPMRREVIAYLVEE